MLALTRRWKADATLIEKTDIGRAVAQDLRRQCELTCILRQPRFDKEARFLAQSARFEGRQVHVPQDAPWLADWMSEILAFPNGRNDDQVDATSQALDYLTTQTAHIRRAEVGQERLQRKARPKRLPRPPGFASRESLPQETCEVRTATRSKLKDYDPWA